MSHHVYTTEGFVLDSRNTGEANKLLYLLTKELGLVVGVAQGVRHLKSKLRYHMQQYSYGEFSLVKGKEMWRITGAKESYHAPRELKDNREYFLLYVRVLHLLKRLLTGEEKNSELFATLFESFKYLQENKQFSVEELRSFEHVLVLRILNHLGYISGKETIVQFLNGEWNEEIMSTAQINKSLVIEEINASLKATQL